jgi:hypothetical protein
MHKRSSRDVNIMAANVIDSIGLREDHVAADEKNPAAVSLGRLGGLKGGPARAAKLSAKQKSRIAKKAALARWSKNHGE